jgi:hypothetical protein
MANRVLWWETRPAQSHEPKTYVCPFCHRQLLAMNPNTLVFPEGDRSRRRHAHTACVAAERRAGRFLSKSEWQRSQTAGAGGMRAWWRRLFRGA